MSYTPNNVSFYIAAYSGAVSAMTAAGGKIIVNPTPAHYADICQIAGAWAQELDSLYLTVPASTLACTMAEDLSFGIWEEKTPSSLSHYTNPAVFAVECAAIIALITEALAYFSGQGISPDAGGGGSSTFWLDVFEVEEDGQTEFTLSKTPLPDGTESVMLFVNGVLYDQQDDDGEDDPAPDWLINDPGPPMIVQWLDVLFKLNAGDIVQIYYQLT